MERRRFLQPEMTLYHTGNKRAAFTLAELLAVIAILGIVVAASVPAFVGITRGSSMNTSASKLRTTLNLARQWAITHRDTTYVVFPDDGNNLYASNSSHVDKACHAYNVYSRKDGYLGEWSYLDPGIYFIPRVSLDPRSPEVTKDTKNVFRDATLKSLPWPDNSGTNAVLNSIGFKPDGTLVDVDGGGVEIYLGEGFITLDASAGTVTDLDFKPTSSIFSLDVYRFTGLSRVRDYQP